MIPNTTLINKNPQELFDCYESPVITFIQPGLDKNVTSSIN